MSHCAGTVLVYPCSPSISINTSFSLPKCPSLDSKYVVTYDKAFSVLKFSLLHTGVLLSLLLVEPAIYFVQKKKTKNFPLTSESVPDT